MNKEHKKPVKAHNFYSITPVLFVFFPNIISLKYVLHFDVGTSQIEWNLKGKNEISVCTAIMLSNHSNPYIQSTTIPIERVYYPLIILNTT